MKNNTPEIRFPGFTGDWEQLKLGEVFEQTSEYVNPREKNLELWSLTVENGLTPKTERYNREFLVKKEDQFKSVANNEFIYNPMNMTLGAVDLNLTGKKVAVSGYYITMKTTDNYDSKYFGTWLKTPLAIKMYKLFATGSLIERQRVQFPTLSQIKASVPSKEEQTKIGDFFKQLDDTIALHQQELTILKQTKQGFLQKMFSKEGKSIPEVRFKGFTRDWEQLKADEIFLSVSDKNHSNLPILSASQEKGMVYRNEIGIDIKYDEKSTKNYKRVLPGQFVIHLRSFQGGFAFSNIEGITSPAYTVLDFKNKEKNYSLYWRVVLASDTFIKRLETVTYGIRDGRSISFSDFSTLKFRVPSYKEQIKIGTFFKQLDDTYALRQRELDALREMKKAFLQKMFI